ncbi:Integrase catalytic domain-containing protein [Abeliophyllum distichum]|uniref:Integrase catalytic domain-containing protein n=1 Tax=Abeliophyllum distichum TaxID=126358 RepID=A0ABD1T0H2_9LAMI
MVLEEDPFALEIMVVPLPKEFKQPMVESYDAVTNPLDHLWMFVDMMILYVAPDVVMCQSFSPTLYREARDWVATLASPKHKSYARSSGVGSNQKKTRSSQDITFGEKNLIGVVYSHDDALVITGDIADFDVKSVLIDNGSATNVLTWDALLGLKAPLEKLRPVITPLQGFGRATITPEGTIELPVTLGTDLASITIITNFLLVKIPMAYNAMHDRPLLNAAMVVVSTYH